LVVSKDDRSMQGESEEDSGHVLVIGAGYVGLTTAACLASLGHRVVCADIDVDRVEQLRRGQMPIFEAGLDELVADGIANGHLEFVVGSAEAATKARVVFLAVPTPQGEDGSADLRFVEAAAAEIGPQLRSGAVVVNKSTVPVGSTRVVERVLARGDVKVVSNPEFLREGTAIHDFLNPDRIVIGSDDPEAAGRVARLYTGLDTEIILTDPASAETIKYAANGFLAMKISFVNAVAALCEAVGADVADVVRGIGLDRRIGPDFLRPGPGWGGSCFPKDTQALVRIASDHGYDFSMMRGVIEVNREQLRRMVNKVMACLEATATSRGLDGAIVGALGLTFKAGTDDLRDSPALAVLAQLAQLGMGIRAHDPTVGVPVSSSLRTLLGSIEVVEDPLAAAVGADVLLVLTEWPEYREIDLAGLAQVMRGRQVIDMRNLLDPQVVRAAGLEYEGVGRR